MNHRLLACPLLLVFACDAPEPTPEPEPRAPWGVPITGGTMLVTRDGAHAIVADPDRDRVLSVALPSGRVDAELPLGGHDEPGRVVEDGAGRLHVVLRRGGAILTLDPSARPLERRAVCPEPRGLAYDATRDLLHVACTGGELVTLPAAGGPAVRALRLDRDLRDVVVAGDQLVVTRFRSAEVLTLDAAGAVVTRFTPPMVQRLGLTGAPTIPISPSVAAVAWRSIPLADGRVLISHQRQVQGTLGTTPDGYGGGCGGRTEATLTTARPGEEPFAVQHTMIGTLPVDVAVSKAGDRVAVVSAGSQRVHVLAATQLDQPDGGDGCGEPPTTGDARPGGSFTDELGAPTSLAYAPGGELVIFYPELPGLVVRTDATARTLVLPGGVGYDAGRALFHRQTGSRLACASCHPEARDDGLVWDFADLGRRRTQSLAGGISRRAPYHWSGDLDSLSVLMEEVFSGRMSGGALTESERRSLGPWLDRVAAPAPSPGDAQAIARGRALFESTEVGCAACHGGDQLTSNGVFAVGTGAPGEAFKAPSLRGLADRAPYMHDGCAATLLDRFGACGGGELHGHTAQLSTAALGDLVAYLESL